MTFRERLEWLARMALMVFILASVAFLSALMAIRFAIQGREVAMPNVIGMKAIAAQQMLQGRGVGMRVEDRIYSTLPVDSLVRQSPPANMRVKIGQYAHVVLSLGPQHATIPKLEEASLRSARIELLRSGLQVGEISTAYLPGWGENQVLQQDPAPGATDNASPHVNFLVSLDARPPAYVMPELVGLPLGEAEAKLRSVGLRVAKLMLSPTSGATHGSVIGQTPLRGQRVDAGSNIELQVAE
ncbi:MAG TPA: PASTA domain-containing protein [Candidatus Acidoferrum sp.]|nr:PASTA domain-containing protein [Candidatus Acidoferrum sp.]